MLEKILKMAGINIPPETIAQLEVIIPQIPQKLVEWSNHINHVIQVFDQRLTRIEAQLERMENEHGGRLDSDNRTVNGRIGNGRG